MRKILKSAFFLFSVFWTAAVLPNLAVLSHPQSWYRSGIYGLTAELFDTNNFQSDGSGVYLSALIVLAISLLLGAVFSRFSEKLRTFSYRWRIFFLSLVLLKYGWMKVTFAQFYPPDPNILDSSFGSLSQDTVYWSLVGSSHSYQLFMGVCELLGAALLLFRRTRFLGLIASTAIFTNVFGVNASFDISVKLLSLTCLLLSVSLLLSYTDVLGKMVQSDWPPVTLPPASPALSWTSGVLILLTEVLFPAFINQQPLSNHHTGTYELANGQRFYVHRMGYVILPDGGKLRSCSVRMDGSKETTFIHAGHIDTIYWDDAAVVCRKSGQRLRFGKRKRQDALMRQSFHWCSDEFH